MTILGYSLYDTIIVFDRIRENVPRMPRAAFSQIVNRSMSEVLTRSLATSFSTLLAVVSLLIFGGATLQDFAFAMMIGIVSGTYSSIFIASPVLTAWKEREPGYIRRRQRIAEVEGGLVPAFADGMQVAMLAERRAERRRRRRRPRRGDVGGRGAAAERAKGERGGDRRSAQPRATAATRSRRRPAGRSQAVGRAAQTQRGATRQARRSGAKAGGR